MDKKKSENPLSRLMGLVGKQKKKYAISIVLAILGVAAGIIPYFAVARMLIALIGGTKEVSFFAGYCLMAAAGYLLKVLFSIWSTSVSHTATFEVLKEIRKKLISKLSRLPMGVILDKLSQLITHQYPLEQLEEAINKQMSADSIKVQILPQLKS